MGQHYQSEYANAGGEDPSSPPSEGIDGTIQTSVSEAVDNAVDGPDSPDTESPPQFEDYDSQSEGDQSDSLNGPDEYSNEDLWDRENRSTGPDSGLNEGTSSERQRRPGVSDRPHREVEVPEPDVDPEQIDEQIAALQEGGGVEIGPGAGNELTADNHSMERRIAAETDQNAIVDEALGPSGDYASPEAGPDSADGMAFQETVTATPASNGGTAVEDIQTKTANAGAPVGADVEAPAEAYEEYIEGNLSNFGLEEGMGTDGLSFTEQTLNGLDQETIQQEAKAYADKQMMDIGGERVERRRGHGLAQQETSEAQTNVALQQRERAQQLVDEYGEDKARTVHTEKTRLVRDGISQEYTRDRDADQNYSPAPRSSDTQTQALLDQYPDQFNAREKAEKRASELAEKYDTTEEEARRYITDELLHDPDKKSVVHKQTRSDGENVPKLRAENAREATTAGREFEQALQSASVHVASESDPIPHSGFHKAVQDSANHQDGLRRGKVKGRVKGVVTEPTAKSKGIKRVCYIEDPDNPRSPDVKVSIWESNEHKPGATGGDMTTDFTKRSPDPEQGDIIEVDNAKVYMNRSAANTNGGIGEPVASADRQAKVSILDSSGRTNSTDSPDSSSADSSTTGESGFSPGTRGTTSGSGGNPVDADVIDADNYPAQPEQYEGSTAIKGLGEGREGDIDRFFNDEGDVNYPEIDR